MPQFLKLW